MWIQPIFSFTELVTCNLKAFMFWETVAFQKSILKNLTKFTGKHLCRSLFFNKVPAWALQLYLKRNTGVGVWSWILWNFDLNFKSTSSGCFCIAKISVPVIEFTDAVKIIVFKISAKYFLLIKLGNLYKVFPSWIRFL